MKWMKSISIALAITVAIIINIVAIVLFNATWNFIYLIPVVVSFVSWLSVLIYIVSD